MSRNGKFGKQAARGRRTFNDNLYRALSGLEPAVFPDNEPAVSRSATETVQNKVARLRAHLKVYRNDGDARKRYEELTGLPWLARETSPQSAPAAETRMSVSRGPELLGFGGGSGGWPEVHLPAGPEELRLSDEDWLILAQVASFGALDQ